MKIKINLIIILSLLSGSLFCNAQVKNSTSPELGVGIARFNTLSISPVCDFSFKIPVNPFYFRSGLFISPFKRGFLEMGGYLGVEKRLDIKKFSFLVGADIGYNNILRKGIGLSRNTYHSDVKIFGAGPVLGIILKPVTRFGISAELGFLAGYGTHPSYQDDWNPSYITWHRYPSVNIIYVLSK